MRVGVGTLLFLVEGLCVPEHANTTGWPSPLERFADQSAIAQLSSVRRSAGSMSGDGSVR